MIAFSAACCVYGGHLYVCLWLSNPRPFTLARHIDDVYLLVYSVLASKSLSAPPDVGS